MQSPEALTDEKRKKEDQQLAGLCELMTTPGLRKIKLTNQ